MKHLRILLLGVLLPFVLYIPGCGEDGELTDDPVIVGKVIDALNMSPVEGAKMYLLYKTLVSQNWVLIDSVLTDTVGSYKFLVQQDRSYQVECVANGYKINKAVDITPENLYAVVDFILAPSSIYIPIGSVSGRVVDKDNKPVEGAVVSVSGGTYTNGYFASTMTNAQGAFGIGVIPIISTSGDSIPYFKLKASKSGYRFDIVDSIRIYEDQTTGNQILKLLPIGNLTAIWSDNFENAGNWITNGFWHRQPNAMVKNVAYPNYVSLGPDDDSEGAIPYAYQGSYCYWYGVANPDSVPNSMADSTGIGNFMGIQSTGDALLSGGTSQYSNYGTLTYSDTINLGGLSEASLNFYSWWEIEGINPNANGFDLMVIQVDTGYGFFDWAKLNPYTDPIDGDRAHKAFTSTGFHRKPIWVNYDIDLTPFAGKKIMIQFYFTTRDGLYNGFRGWFIDDLKIYPIAGSIEGQSTYTKKLESRSR